MSCCINTYNLGCIYHCNQLSFGTADFGGTVVGVFTSGNIVISQSITVVEGEPLIFDMSLLNEEMAYTLTLYHDDEQISLTIDGVEYDCFSVKTTLIGDAIPFVPVPGCTEMCEESYDPTGVSGDVFDYNNMHTGVAVDGVTITGTGKTGDPLVVVGGGISFDCSDLQGCDISLLNNDAGYLTDSILFPNGFKTVSTSRDIDNSDIGYVLYVIEDNIHLSLPTGITLTANRHIGLKLDGTKTGFSFDVENGYPVSLLTVSPDSEFVHLITGSKGGNSTLGIVSSMIINDGGDKTLNRYLYDKINLVSSSLSNYELLSNKSTSVITDQTSNTKYPTVKSVYDWVTSLGFITNVISALGFTPENVSNKQTDLTASATKYPTVDAVNIGLGTKQDTLVSGTNIKTVNSTTLLGSGNISVEPTITAGTTAQYWRGDKTWQTLDKTAVGLGNVENTALSTWVGSTNITTLGTVSTGTWSATAIGATKGGTGQTTYATGDLLYASAANTLSKLAAGTNGHVLTLAAGVPTWAAPSGGGWGLTGNAGTSGYPSNFIGTTDNQDVVFKRNNAYIFALGVNGISVGINLADNKYIGVQGSTTGNPATGYSFLGFGGFLTYTANEIGFNHFNGGSKQMGIGVGTDGITRIKTGSSSGIATAIYINAAYGGNGNVSIGASPTASAKLSVTSTTSGFLPPVMTTTQRDAISSPASGLMIYDSTVNKVSVYNGSVWKYLQYE